MTENSKTLTFAGAALVLLALAWVTTPRTVIPEALQDRGRLFFPEFTDPNAATSLEVVEFDEPTSVARPFKVVNRDGRWTIPSHYNYPADGGDRLSSIAAAVIALRKDDVASDNVGDHERCGVLDPLEATLGATNGHGTRITVKGRNDKILADIIAGKPVDGRPNLRYVRLPGQKRTYVARADQLSISTMFEDWIERNLLQGDRDEIDQIVIRNYAVDGKTGKRAQREMVVLRQTGKDTWVADGMRPGETIDTFRMNLLVTRLIELAIIDVRPKPPGFAAMLGAAGDRPKLLPSDVADLSSKGFYFTSEGRLLSNQGEVLVHTSAGVFYTLRFGEVAPGTSGHRYLFISVGFDPHAAHATATDRGRARFDVLRARFAPWYYIISDDSFKKIRLERKDLLRPK